MDYVTVRELREKSGTIWQRMEAGEEFVVTRNGKPFALLLHTEPAEVEDAVRAHRGVRLGGVIQRLQAQARASGADQLSPDEVLAEVAASRTDRRRRIAPSTTPAHGSPASRGR